MEKRTYQQLSYEDRVKIETLLRDGKSVRSIARTLERSPNTIAREVREKKVRGTYRPKKAQHKTYVRRYWSKRDCMKVAMNPDLVRLVNEKLWLKWSPERIAGYARRNGTLLSKKAVYKYVKSRALDHHLFWKRVKKKRGVKRGIGILRTSRLRKPRNTEQESLRSWKHTPPLLPVANLHLHRLRFLEWSKP